MTARLDYNEDGARERPRTTKASGDRSAGAQETRQNKWIKGGGEYCARKRGEVRGER